MLVRFLTINKIGRRITTVIHRWPLHPDWNHPFRVGQGCLLCRMVQRELAEHADAALADRSSIKISDPEYNEDGSIKRYGMYMSATFQRQMEELSKDPKKAGAVREALEEIARNPRD